MTLQAAVAATDAVASILYLLGPSMPGSLTLTRPLRQLQPSHRLCREPTAGLALKRVQKQRLAAVSDIAAVAVTLPWALAVAVAVMWMGGIGVAGLGSGLEV